MTVLEKALEIAGVSRSRDYGHPLVNHQRIADLWNAYLKGMDGDLIGPEDVAYMMILMKVARLQAGYKEDSLIDVAGYVRCIELMREVLCTRESSADAGASSS